MFDKQRTLPETDFEEEGAVMNTAKELYDRWLAQPELDTAMAEELHGIAGDDAAITDRFYRDLEFGTGGLRGVLGRAPTA